MAELSRKDYLSDSDPRWCPGCGCFPILKGATATFSALKKAKENIAVISGIGCSSRFPYYVDSYGYHTLHGRAPTVATGLKMANPDLNVWIVTGDGDCLSIGGNHFMHLMRRNPDINVMLFNNEIYGLTKGQTSPTSQLGKITKSTPMGSVDKPVKPVRMALAAGATFVARVLDADLKSMGRVFEEAEAHKGISFIEIFFDCNIFNHKVFDAFTNKKTRPDTTVELKAGEPLVYGSEGNKKGLKLNGLKIEVVDLAKGADESGLLKHDPSDANLTYMLSELNHPDFPVPLGVFRKVSEPVYEQEIKHQLEEAVEQKGAGQLDQLLKGSDSWVVGEHKN